MGINKWVADMYRQIAALARSEDLRDQLRERTSQNAETVNNAREAVDKAKRLQDERKKSKGK